MKIIIFCFTFFAILSGCCDTAVDDHSKPTAKIGIIYKDGNGVRQDKFFMSSGIPGDVPLDPHYNINLFSIAIPQSSSYELDLFGQDGGCIKKINLQCRKVSKDLVAISAIQPSPVLFKDYSGCAQKLRVEAYKASASFDNTHYYEFILEVTDFVGETTNINLLVKPE